MRKNSRSGFGLIEFVLLVGLATTLVALMGSKLTCGAIQTLLRIPLPFAGSGPNNALCESTEAVLSTQATFSFILVGLALFMGVRSHLSRRQG